MNQGRMYGYLSVMVLFFFMVCTPAGAVDSVKTILSRSTTGDICSAVKKTIGEGRDAKTVVKTAIELGHNACITIKCALSGGASIEKVVIGAIEAGATSAVTSRCALDGGAEARDVSRYLLSAGISQCYMQPEGLPYTSPPGFTDPAIPEIPRTQALSPSRF